MCGVKYRSHCSGVAWWRVLHTGVMRARRLREGQGLLWRWWRGGGFHGMPRRRGRLPGQGGDLCDGLLVSRGPGQQVKVPVIQPCDLQRALPVQPGGIGHTDLRCVALQGIACSRQKCRTLAAAPNRPDLLTGSQHQGDRRQRVITPIFTPSGASLQDTQDLLDPRARWAHTFAQVSGRMRPHFTSVINGLPLVRELSDRHADVLDECRV
jgi:hypothetical protein